MPKQQAWRIDSIVWFEGLAIAFANLFRGGDTYWLSSPGIGWCPIANPSSEVSDVADFKTPFLHRGHVYKNFCNALPKSSSRDYLGFGIPAATQIERTMYRQSMLIPV